MGISYGGISQLFTAQTDPPDLAAISPLSVIDRRRRRCTRAGSSTPGSRSRGPRSASTTPSPPRPTGGRRGPTSGSSRAIRPASANQVLHGEAANLMAKIRANNHYVPSVADPLAPITFVHKIKVPVFMACQWTDEQTGGHCPDLAEHFTGTTHKWFTFTNGAHVDSLDPDDLRPLVRLPRAVSSPTRRRSAAPRSTGARAGDLPDRRWGSTGVTLAARSDPGAADATPRRWPPSSSSRPIRVLFDNGAGSSTPGDPVPGFEQSFPRFPIPGTQARSWYLAAGGALTAAKPHARPASTRSPGTRTRSPAHRLHRRHGGGPGGLWTATPALQLGADPPGHAPLVPDGAAGRRTPPSIGAGAVHVWVRSSRPDVDLQVDGQRGPPGRQGDVRAGRLAARQRAQARPAKSTLLEPVRASGRADVSPLPAGRFAEVTSRSTTRATCTAPARGSGSRSPHPAATSRSGRSARRARPGHATVVDRLLEGDALAPDPSGRARRARPDRPAAVPGSARRAVPGVPAVANAR